MRTRLTLRLEDQLIEKAKLYAAQAGKSVSQIVADYFKLLTSQKRRTEFDYSPHNRIPAGLVAGVQAGGKGLQKNPGYRFIPRKRWQKYWLLSLSEAASERPTGNIGAGFFTHI